ncbi:MAG: nitroreductase [Myxococcota bacterium]
MNLHDALSTRRTIQRFRPGSVPDAVIDDALAAAVWAPNHKTTWPFRFVLPGPAARHALYEVGVSLKAAKRGGEVTPQLEAEQRAKMLDPDRLVVVVQRVADDPVRAEEDYATCACAVFALMLSVHASGFGTKWSTGGVTTDPRSLALLGLAPAEDRVVGFVWVGVPEVVPQAPRRPPLAGLVRRTD